ncbi:dephospho-CoA kinase [Bacillus massiliigorillae]|uniref:dephospho-CoA kinase n=1 Tax=Bacillus massiliigorillae TaxID=1243664 RepID=UPI00039D0761|nr:dephospho-CoA kinase [Bacillus massiliigorillae]
MRKVIGVTGGIASGKSTVSKMIVDLGFTVVDADLVARKVVEPGEAAYEPLKEAFGLEIFKEDATLNREKLGAIIFHDQEKRLLLNSIMHPAIQKYMDDQKEAAFARGEEVVFMDIPLLFEGKSHKTVDLSLLVFVDDEVQLQRLMERNGLSKDDALARIHSQMPLAKKKELADAVIDNNGTIEETKNQLRAILDNWDVKYL